MKPFFAVLLASLLSVSAFADLPFPPPEKLVPIDVSKLLGSTLSTATYESTLNAFRAAGLLSNSGAVASSTIAGSQDGTELLHRSRIGGLCLGR